VRRLVPLLAVLAALAAVPAAQASVGSDAARAFSRGLFVSSPGGVVATAARVSRWHRLAVRATRGSRVSPLLLEGMIFVESSGRPRVVGLDRRRGLTQLSTRRMRPAAQLRATVRRLERARRALGRLDLAVASYHLDAKHLARARSFASFYFRTSLQGPRADYYWKVLAAERVLRLYRHDRAALRYEQRLQFKKNSAEEVLHPRTSTPQFRGPVAIAHAWHRHYLVTIPRDAARTHIRISPSLGELAGVLHQNRRLYATLRPQALHVLLFIGRQMRQWKPLVLTSAVRDRSYQRLLTSVNAAATRAYSMHTTGYAFDIRRSFASGTEKRAFFRLLDRLQAVNAIAYIPELAALHIAVASDAPQKLALLRKLG
jgi:hypothetical protein